MKVSTSVEGEFLDFVTDILSATVSLLVYVATGVSLSGEQHSLDNNVKGVYQ